MTENPKWKLRKVILHFTKEGIQLAIEKDPYDLFTKDEDLLPQAIFAMELLVENYRQSIQEEEDNATKENPNLN